LEKRQNWDRVKYDRKKTNPEYLQANKVRQEKLRNELQDGYVKRIIYIQSNLTIKQINEHPELVQAYKESLRLKRLLKQMKGKIKNHSCHS